MPRPAWLPFAQPDALQSELAEEIRELESQLEHFDSLPAERRFASPDIYRELIRVRRELLRMLEAEGLSQRSPR